MRCACSRCGYSASVEWSGMAKVRYTGSGRLKLRGTKYDAIESGETATVTAEVAESIDHREDVERVDD